jgi:hypothetical protein
LIISGFCLLQHQAQYHLSKIHKNSGNLTVTAA